MAADQRAATKAQLGALLPRIMEDGRVDEAERIELKGLFAQGALTVGDVKDVLRDYLAKLSAEILADGFVTDEEQAKVRTVVRELAIPHTLLPPELLAVIQGKPLPR